MDIGRDGDGSCHSVGRRSKDIGVLDPAGHGIAYNESEVNKDPKEVGEIVKITQEHKAMLASYGRSIIGAAVATYTATQDWKMTLNALWAAAIPVAMRYLNTNDPAFGRVGKK